MLNVATVSVTHSKHSLMPRPYYYYVYAQSNDIHNVATNVLLTQQLFMALIFLVKFKTLGYMSRHQKDIRLGS